ncbi:MAG: cyclic pyranopterin monophosphate synthase MoaC [Devosiaceae bacterium]|nr:cyclic pyranopterin monophosphate synthase MoaC [Devosiaceae bacterium MH13]
MKDRLTHTDQAGKASMVDVSGKPVTARIARASGTIAMLPDTVAAIRDNRLKKGDVLATARIAGVMAAKKTHDLIPLCHPLPLADVQVDIDEIEGGFQVATLAKTTGQTGVEMEALTACSVALLTLYDMAKAIDRHMVIGEIKVTEKAGGASGNWSLEAVSERGA